MGRLYYFHLFPSDKSIGFSVKCYAGCPARPQQARARDTARPRECRGFGQRLSADGFGQWLGEQTAPGNLGSSKKGEKDREPCRVAVVTSQLAMHGSCATHTRPQAHLPAARQGGLSDSPGHALCPKAASGSSRKCSFRKTGSPALGAGAEAAESQRWISTRVWVAGGVVSPSKPSQTLGPWAEPPMPPKLSITERRNALLPAY